VLAAQSFLRRKGLMPYFERARKKWRGVITVNGKRHSALFETKREAKAWENQAKNTKPISKNGFLELADEYITFCDIRFVPKVVSQKKVALKKLYIFCGQNQDLSVQDVTADIATKFLAEMAAKFSASTSNAYRKDLKAFWNWMIKYKDIQVNPFSQTEKIPYTPRYIHTPSETDVLRIFACTSGQDRVMLRTYIETGFRKREVFRLKWDDIILDSGQIRVGDRKTGGKGMRYVWVRISDGLLKDLKWWYKHRTFPDSPYVFVNEYRSNSYGQPFLRRNGWILKLCRIAGVKEFNYHSLRRFVASMAADKFKQSLPTIQQLLRHSNLSTTEKYIRSIRDSQDEVANMFGDWVDGSDDEKPTSHVVRPK